MMVNISKYYKLLIYNEKIVFSGLMLFMEIYGHFMPGDVAKVGVASSSLVSRSKISNKNNKLGR